MEEVLAAICDTFIPSINSLHHDPCVTDFYALSASQSDIPTTVLNSIDKFFRSEVASAARTLLTTLSSAEGTFALFLPSSSSTTVLNNRSFTQLNQLEREELLLGWADCEDQSLKSAFNLFRALVLYNFYTKVDSQRTNPSWKSIGYPGPDPHTLHTTLSPKPLQHAVIDTSKPLLLRESLQAYSTAYSTTHSSEYFGEYSGESLMKCDAVIVGSGCGGGVIAAILAKAGYRVIVIEKGKYKARDDLSQYEGEAMSELYETGSFLTTDDGKVGLLAGTCVGGGTTINWSAAFRTPSHVIKEWTTRHHLNSFGSKQYAQAMEAVCERLGVQEDFHKESFCNRVLRKGCKELGFFVGNTPRNAAADHYCGWCHLGCRCGKKKSVAETWLVDAANAGAKILTNCTAERITFTSATSGRRRRKATGVLVRFGGSDEIVKISANVTVVACGSIHTPCLLMKSGLKNPNIGKNLRLHPVQLVWGYFPEEEEEEEKDVSGCNSFEGGIMTAYSTVAANWESSGYGALIQTPILHPGHFSVTISWRSGRDHKRRMVNFARTAHMIVLLREKESAGIITLDPEGNHPHIEYSLDPYDVANSMEGAVNAVRAMAAAGAKEIGGNRVEGGDTWTREEGNLEEYIRGIKERGMRLNSPPLVSAHQMGSCRMGKNERDSVADEKCECWEAEGLFLGDGSVFPTATGVNPMITIQSIAYCTAHHILHYLAPFARL